MVDKVTQLTHCLLVTMTPQVKTGRRMPRLRCINRGPLWTPRLLILRQVLFSNLFKVLLINLHFKDPDLDLPLVVTPLTQELTMLTI